MKLVHKSLVCSNQSKFKINQPKIILIMNSLRFKKYKYGILFKKMKLPH